MVIRTSVAAFLILLTPLVHAAVSLTGADGRSVTLSNPATRIVSLAPDLTELVYAVGAGSVMVGTSDYSDYPAAAKQVPRIGDAFRVDTERLLALKPDLVLAWQGGTPVSVIERLRQLKLPVLVIGTRQLADIAANLELVGRATGRDVAAHVAAQAFQAGLGELRARYANRQTVRVFYEISTKPLYTIGGGQIVSRMIELCGGRNIFSDLKPLAASVSLESVLSRDPQAIVTGGYQGADERLQEWRQWPQLDAVKTRSLYSISGDLLNRATPRLLEGGKQLCEDLAGTRQRLQSR